MAVITDIAALSQNPTLNGPDGATDPPSTLDDQLRYDGSFIAKLRDGVGFTAGALPTALGFTPVQQGTGTSQLTNTVKIGWSATSQLRAQVDATDFGVNWPINITGNAATATNATNATTLGGVAPNIYVKSVTGNLVALTWDSANGYVYPTVDGIAQSSYVIWNKVQGRPTDLASFTNSPGYQTAGQLIAFAVQRTGAVVSIGNSGTTHLTVDISGAGAFAWPISPSDQRLKKDIDATQEDSLSKILRIDFKQYRFRDDVMQMPIDDGRLHKLGLIAQQLQSIDPEWVTDAGTWLAPDQQTLLYSAMHAIKQLEAKVAALEAR